MSITTPNPYILVRSTLYNQSKFNESVVKTDTFNSIGLLSVGSGAVVQVPLSLSRYSDHTVLSLTNIPASAINGQFVASGQIVASSNTLAIVANAAVQGIAANKGISAGGNIYSVTRWDATNVAVFTAPPPSQVPVTNGQAIQILNGTATVSAAELLLYAYTANGQVIGCPNLFTSTLLANGTPISSVYQPIPPEFMPIESLGVGTAAITNLNVFANAGNSLAVVQYSEANVVYAESGPRFLIKNTGNVSISANAQVSLYESVFSYVSA